VTDLLKHSTSFFKQGAVLIKLTTNLCYDSTSPGFLRHGASIDLQELEKFCELFQCTPNDLLQWFPDKDEITETHPLASLKRSDNVPYLTKLLYSVPLDKIAEIESMIKEKLKD
jgi:DNA-binding Xre family transcriptional regulator